MAGFLDRFRLDGQIAVVTGATGGIGRSVIRAFAEAGAGVVGLDRSLDGPPIDGASDARMLDVADPAAIDAAFQEIDRDHGPIAVLVSNAGVSHVAPTTELQLADWDRVVDINLRGTVFCAQAAARSMIRNGGGSIITISSQLGLTPAAERAAYIASKAGIIGLTKSLAIEWAPNNIRVNSVAPGTTNTPMTSYLQQNQEAGDAFRRRIPLGRFGEPDETAAACLFLASPAASYVTGHTLVVDGGYSVW